MTEHCAQEGDEDEEMGLWGGCDEVKVEDGRCDGEEEVAVDREEHPVDVELDDVFTGDDDLEDDDAAEDGGVHADEEDGGDLVMEHGRGVWGTLKRKWHCASKMPPSPRRRRARRRS